MTNLQQMHPQAWHSLVRESDDDNRSVASSQYGGYAAGSAPAYVPHQFSAEEFEEHLRQFLISDEAIRQATKSKTALRKRFLWEKKQLEASAKFPSLWQTWVDEGLLVLSASGEEFEYAPAFFDKKKKEAIAPAVMEEDEEEEGGGEERQSTTAASSISTSGVPPPKRVEAEEVVVAAAAAAKEESVEDPGKIAASIVEDLVVVAVTGGEPFADIASTQAEEEEEESISIGGDLSFSTEHHYQHFDERLSFGNASLFDHDHDHRNNNNNNNNNSSFPRSPGSSFNGGDYFDHHPSADIVVPVSEKELLSDAATKFHQYVVSHKEFQHPVEKDLQKTYKWFQKLQSIDKKFKLAHILKIWETAGIISLSQKGKKGSAKQTFVNYHSSLFADPAISFPLVELETILGWIELDNIENKKRERLQLNWEIFNHILVVVLGKDWKTCSLRYVVRLWLSLSILFHSRFLALAQPLPLAKLVLLGNKCREKLQALRERKEKNKKEKEEEEAAASSASSKYEEIVASPSTIDYLMQLAEKRFLAKHASEFGEIFLHPVGEKKEEEKIAAANIPSYSSIAASPAKPLPPPPPPVVKATETKPAAAVKAPPKPAVAPKVVTQPAAAAAAAAAVPIVPQNLSAAEAAAEFRLFLVSHAFAKSGQLMKQHFAMVGALVKVFEQWKETILKTEKKTVPASLTIWQVLSTWRDLDIINYVFEILKEFEDAKAVSTGMSLVIVLDFRRFFLLNCAKPKTLPSGKWIVPETEIQRLFAEWKKEDASRTDSIARARRACSWTDVIEQWKKGFVTRKLEYSLEFCFPGRRELARQFYCYFIDKSEIMSDEAAGPAYDSGTIDFMNTVHRKRLLSLYEEFCNIAEVKKLPFADIVNSWKFDELLRLKTDEESVVFVPYNRAKVLDWKRRFAVAKPIVSPPPPPSSSVANVAVTTPGAITVASVENIADAFRQHAVANSAFRPALSARAGDLFLAWRKAHTNPLVRGCPFGPRDILLQWEENGYVKRPGHQIIYNGSFFVFPTNATATAATSTAATKPPPSSLITPTTITVASLDNVADAFRQHLATHSELRHTLGANTGNNFLNWRKAHTNPLVRTCPFEPKQILLQWEENGYVRRPGDAIIYNDSFFVFPTKAAPTPTPAAAVEVPKAAPTTATTTAAPAAAKLPPPPASSLITPTAITVAALDSVADAFRHHLATNSELRHSLSAVAGGLFAIWTKNHDNPLVRTCPFEASQILSQWEENGYVQRPGNQIIYNDSFFVFPTKAAATPAATKPPSSSNNPYSLLASVADEDVVAANSKSDAPKTVSASPKMKLPLDEVAKQFQQYILSDPSLQYIPSTHIGVKFANWLKTMNIESEDTSGAVVLRKWIADGLIERNGENIRYLPPFFKSSSASAAAPSSDDVPAKEEDLLIAQLFREMLAKLPDRPSDASVLSQMLSTWKEKCGIASPSRSWVVFRVWESQGLISWKDKIEFLPAFFSVSTTTTTTTTNPPPPPPEPPMSSYIFCGDDCLLQISASPSSSSSQAAAAATVLSPFQKLIRHIEQPSSNPLSEEEEDEIILFAKNHSVVAELQKSSA